jgi:hypothetical protein
VLKVFGGRIVVEDKPLFCDECDKVLKAHYAEEYLTAPVEKLVRLIRLRKARIVLRTWPDGRRDWMCHSCGRHVGDFAEVKNGEI